MKMVFALAALALAGCQNMEQLRASAPQQSDFTICKALVMGNATLQQVAAEEQQRRRLDCSPHMPAIAQAQQADMARTAVGLQLLQQSQPRPQPIQPYIMPAPVTCNSYRYGNQVQTTCR